MNFPREDNGIRLILGTFYLLQRLNGNAWENMISVHVGNGLCIYIGINIQLKGVIISEH